MPFDYQKFDTQCASMSTEELLKQYKHYDKLCAMSMSGTVTSALTIPLTLGVSGLAIGLSAPAHHNAKKKLLIVDKYLKARGIQAEQARQYANALAANEAQKNAAGPSTDQKVPAPSDQKHEYTDGKSEKRSSSDKKGSAPPDAEAPPPPPPTYDEALASPSSSQASTRLSPPPQPPQAYGPSQGGWNAPPPGWNMPQGGWSGPQMGYGPPQQMYGQQQPGWGSPQGGWGGPQGYCAPQAGPYGLHSAMHTGPYGPDSRHVHFTQ